MLNLWTRKMTPDEMQINLGYIVKWEPKFETGIPVIDSQHKKLFMLCNNLHMALNNKEFGGSWEDEFRYSIRECFEYCKVHFKSEETLMQAAGFHGLREHKEVHALFIKKVIEYSSMESYSISSAFKLIRFLYEWILSHIAHDDKLFVKSVMKYIETRNSYGSSAEEIQ